jgi:dienelactone hydrolase
MTVSRSLAGSDDRIDATNSDLTVAEVAKECAAVACVECDYQNHGHHQPSPDARNQHLADVPAAATF